MKKLVAELEGNELDHWVYKAINVDGIFLSKALPKYSTDWQQAGPIIERELISLEPATKDSWSADKWMESDEKYLWYEGASPLIAAMRVFVASKFGEYVEIE